MPIPVISIAQMREWEKATWEMGQTEAEVIRLVGRAVAARALRMSSAGDSILILAGKGNNGKDALSAKEHMAARRVQALEVADPAAALPRLEELLASDPVLIIDALFGVGLNRPLGRDWIRFIEKTQYSFARILAVDVPSGLNADTGEPEGAAVKAHVTLTVGAPKAGMLRQSAWGYVGRLEVATDVGLTMPPREGELFWTLPQDFRSFPPVRPAATHKGSYGHLGIVAGSVGFHGAAVLAARGAQRAQPGLVTLHTMSSVYQPVASQLQAVMVSPWTPATKLDSGWSAVLAGPGLAAREVPDELKDSVRRLWKHSELPVVVDASALDWLPTEPVSARAARVITPHPGEAGRLLKSSARDVQANRLGALRQLSKLLGNVWVVLKGHQTLIGRSTGPVFVNSSGNPHLAQGGSGDLLSGYIAGLLAQPELPPDPLTLLRYAVWQHGHSADLLQEARSNWMVEDLASALGDKVDTNQVRE